MITINAISKSATIKDSIRAYDVFSLDSLISDIAHDNGLEPEQIKLGIKDEESGDVVPLEFWTESKTLPRGGEDFKAWKIFVKDDGLQVDTAFIKRLSYGLPLLHCCGLFVLGKFFSGMQTYSQTRKVAFTMIAIHYFWRLFEELWSLRYSRNERRRTTPYWFGKLFVSAHNLISYVLCVCLSTSEDPWNFPFNLPTTWYMLSVNSFSKSINLKLFSLWTIAEYLSFLTHQAVPGSSKVFGASGFLVKHFGQKWVFLSYYLFEVLSWFFVAVLVGHWSAWLSLFAVCILSILSIRRALADF